MWKTTSLACISCDNPNHCAECRSYSQSSLAFKAFESKKVSVKYPTTYKKVANFSHASGVQTNTICSQCESKLCFACSMYNTHFIKES